MKEINLLQHENFYFEFTQEQAARYGLKGNLQIGLAIRRDGLMDKIDLTDETGEPLSNLMVGDGKQDLQQARKNGNEIICAAIALDKKMNEIIAFYLFGSTYPDPKREYFNHNILNTSHLEFGSKKTIVLDILDKMEIFGVPGRSDSRGKNATKNEKKEFENDLFKMMRYRNAFAHGDITYSASSACVLQYYSNGHKREELTDVFWTEIEEAHSRIDKRLNKAIEKLKPQFRTAP